MAHDLGMLPVGSTLPVGQVEVHSQKEQRDADRQQGVLTRAEESPTASQFLVLVLPGVTLLLSFILRYSHLSSYNKAFRSLLQFGG